MDKYYLNWFLNGEYNLKYSVDEAYEIELYNTGEAEKLLVKYLSDNRQSTTKILGTLTTVISQIDSCEWNFEELEIWTEILMESIYKIFRSNSNIKQLIETDRHTKSIIKEGDFQDLRILIDKIHSPKVLYEFNLAEFNINLNDLKTFTEYSHIEFLQFIGREVFPKSVKMIKEATRLTNKFGKENHWFQTNDLDELDSLYDETMFIYVFIEVLSAWFISRQSQSR